MGNTQKVIIVMVFKHTDDTLNFTAKNNRSECTSCCAKELGNHYVYSKGVHHSVCNRFSTLRTICRTKGLLRMSVGHHHRFVNGTARQAVGGSATGIRKRPPPRRSECLCFALQYVLLAAGNAAVQKRDTYPCTTWQAPCGACTWCRDMCGAP